MRITSHFHIGSIVAQTKPNDNHSPMEKFEFSSNALSIFFAMVYNQRKNQPVKVQFAEQLYAAS
jgi:hypothetical protein